MRIGDRVTWESQSRGVWAIKTGRVVAVVETDQAIAPLKEAFRLTHNIGPIWLARLSRGHESYLVEVRTGGEKAKKSIYWPLVRNLNIAD